MPPWGMHMTVARELAAALAHRALDAEPGAFYLGATAPDIRALTKWDRSRTHFFDLHEFGHQRGVDALFREHDELASPACLSPQAVAFVCGYISHLEMDEAWICDVYRPCFGERSALKGDLLANLLDRVLQFELDRRRREDAAAVEGIRNDVIAHTVEAAVAFLERETLEQWRELIVELLGHEPDWERFRGNVGRHLRSHGIDSRHPRSHGIGSEEELARFLQNIPDLLDQALREVTQERLDAFEERSRERSLAAIREYLS